jgi:diguanylate cyclase (GGDEF)-like protein/PAS domain S-box-containing protein
VPSLDVTIGKRVNTDHSRECVLLIVPRAEEATTRLEELNAATDEGFDVEWVSDLPSGIKRLCSGGIGSVVLDMASPDSQGIEIFDQLFRAAPGTPMLVMVGADAEEMGRNAIRRGAQDYLVKNRDDGYRLRRAVRTMMERRFSGAIVLQNEFANLMLDSIGEAVLRTDTHGNVAYLNRIAEHLTGWRQPQALGRPVSEVLRIFDAVSGAGGRSVLQIVTRADKTASGMGSCRNCILIQPDGFELGIEITVTQIHNQDGAATGAIVAFRDVTAARATSLEMSHLAQHDFLTDLPNRMLFNDRLKQAISLATRHSKQLAVLFVDLDHFKKINDSLGHRVGDKVLKSVAERLASCVRRTDTVSRIGGDEFVVLLSQVENGEDAAVSARKILRVLALPHLIENKSLDVNVSIGVSTYPSDGADAEILMNKADTAMYEAKQQGRNTCQFFRRDMQTRLADRQLLERDLRYALGRNEFLLHYQPKVDLQGGRITGVEALIRWEHPERGLIYPSQFVPIAEECGLIVAIGRWVLREACRQARAWSGAGLGVVPIAVNVSASEFEDKDFLSCIRATLIASGVEPAKLELELTESVLMQDAESTVRTLAALKAMGVQLAIDDFGTGYSSFTYLRRFPVDALKLHQSFVQEITADAKDATIVDAMINIGKSLKRRVIAEGVETRAQLNFLQRHGCAEGQGYYFSRPIAAEQVGTLLKSVSGTGAFNSQFEEIARV